MCRGGQFTVSILALCTDDPRRGDPRKYRESQTYFVVKFCCPLGTELSWRSPRTHFSLCPPHTQIIFEGRKPINSRSVVCINADYALRVILHIRMSGGVAVVESVDERVRDSATPHLVSTPQPVLGSGECYSPTRADFTFIILALGHLTSPPRRQQHKCVIK